MHSIPDFHDGYLSGFRTKEGEATIFIERVDGVEFEIKLIGLEKLQITDFRQGNTILDIEVVVGRAPHASIAFDRLFPPPHPSATKSYKDQYVVYLNRQKARIASGEMCLLIIEPGYGADLLATCREISCHPVAS